MEEVWKPVVGLESAYEVSNLGRARSKDRIVTRRAGNNYVKSGRLLSNHSDHLGYVRWSFKLKGIRKCATAHTIVLTAFVGDRPGGMHGCHNDGNPSNNCLSNLRWDTVSGNHADKRKHGTQPLGTRSHLCKLTEAQVIAIRASNASCTELGKKFGIHRMTVSLIRTRRRWAWLP